MTYNEKKSLYESIMKEVAKTVKRKINETVDSDLRQMSQEFKDGKKNKCDLLSLSIAKLIGEFFDTNIKRSINIPVAIERIKETLELITVEGKEKQFVEDMKKVFSEL